MSNELEITIVVCLSILILILGINGMNIYQDKIRLDKGFRYVPPANGQWVKD